MDDKLEINLENKGNSIAEDEASLNENKENCENETKENKESLVEKPENVHAFLILSRADSTMVVGIVTF